MSKEEIYQSICEASGLDRKIDRALHDLVRSCRAHKAQLPEPIAQALRVYDLLALEQDKVHYEVYCAGRTL